MRVWPMRVVRPLRRLPRASRVRVGTSRNCCRFMCHRLVGHPPSSAGVPHMRCNASLSAGARDHGSEESYHISFVALHLLGERHRGLFFTTASRNWVVICCTSLPLSANSWAICSLDRFNPMQYRHSIHTFTG